MGSISLNVSGGGGPYNVLIRELSEISGNRCTSCNGISSLSNIPVNYIADGQPHTYFIQVSNPSATVPCHPGNNQFTITCNCQYIPTVVASSSCSPNIISITPSITNNIPLTVIVMEGVTEVYNNIVNSGSTITVSVEDGKTYEFYAAVPGALSCKSITQAITIDCEEECTISVTPSNPQC